MSSHVVVPLTHGDIRGLGVRNIGCYGGKNGLRVLVDGLGQGNIE